MDTNEINRETLPADYYSCPMITDMHFIVEGDLVKYRHRVVGVCCQPRIAVPRVPLGETGEKTIQNYLNMRKILLQEGHLSLDAQERTVSKACTKCPQYRKMKRDFSEKIGYLNLSPYPSPCNAKCVYCGYNTDTFEFSADEAKAYQVMFDAVEYAQTTGLVSLDVHFLLFAGEITVHPYKQRILDIVGNNHSLFATNCFLFDERIAKNLASNPKSIINFSIDSGTKETWKKVKGVGNFDKAVENLLKYRKSCVRGDQIQLKYIILPGINDDIKDFTGCIELMKNLGVSSLRLARNNDENYPIGSHDSEKLMKTVALFVMMLRYNGLTEIIQPAYTPDERKRIEELTKDYKIWKKILGNAITNITKIRGLVDYITALIEIKENNLIIIVAKDNIGFSLTEEHADLLLELGLKADVSMNRGLARDPYRGFIAVIDKGENVAEILANSRQIAELKIDNYDILSTFWTKEKGCPSAHIFINGKNSNYIPDARGLNFLVIDKATGKIIDSVAFDTHVENTPISKRLEVIFFQFKAEAKERLMLCNLLPEVSFSPKIKVRVFLKFHVGWIALKSLCSVFHNDPKYDILIIIDKIPVNKACVAQEGYSYVYETEYKASQDNPDIIILIQTWGPHCYSPNQLLDICDNTKIVVSLPFGMLKMIPSISDWVNELLAGPKEADYYILDKLAYSTIEKAGLLKPSMVHIGNPKYDAIYNAMQKREELPKEWEKTSGKKVFLLTTDHLDPRLENVTFDLYANHFFEYFNKHSEDCALIIRPHPVYTIELLENGMWTREDYENIKKYCENSENIIWDERADYTLSYQLADCIFTDVACGIILSALTVDKPVCVLLRYDGYTCEIFHPEVIEHHNVVKNPEELVEFLDRVRAGEDPKAELRREALAKFISHYDGKNGQRIKAFIEEKFMEKFGENQQQAKLPHD